MDVARNLHTGELVEAEELWNMDVVEKDAYVCRGCATRVFPASYDPAVNKRRPYFTLGKGNHHAQGCDVDGENTIVSRARQERVGGSDGFPMPFPSNLSLSDAHPASPPGSAAPAFGSATLAAVHAAARAAARRQYHGHTVKTIRPLCRTYINFPNDRAYLPLEIPGVWGSTYAQLFWLIPNKKPAFFNNPRHLFHAPIRWKVEPVISDTHCELTLSAGQWDSATRGYLSLCRLRVDWSGWSDTRRRTLLHEIEAARTEAVEHARRDSQVKGWIFFIGTQDRVDPGLFHVDDARFICCLAARMTWPERQLAPA
ncbi:hypothetical protein [Massilia pseudoviolaceinigra]|uniref:hypothetical protein n=1 Tax=Massilia pseudoviolaceinigra TaxID=3057165 RepID=UPI00279646DD|nr:hypothetical protein [Massilia sp. CCM 9206]MDQ1918826.1 hypothetical protein [Massilia sp. CCM 9206]